MMIYLADVYGTGEFRGLDKLDERDLDYILRCCSEGVVSGHVPPNNVVEQIQLVRAGRAMGLLPRKLI